MELLANLSLGLETAFTVNNLLFCLIGVFLGTAIGVLPGLGPTATIAMLLPITFGLPPVSSLIMLSGIYYGAQYGGVHHGDSGQSSWGVLLGGYGAGWLSNGKAG